MFQYYANLFLFQIYPYVALSVFFIGSWLRYDRAMYTWRTGSSQLLSDRGMRLGSNLFHIGILVILGGHLVGLLTPHWLYEIFISSAHKQLLAMVVGGAAAVVCLIGISILLARRLSNPRIRATGTFADSMILILLFVQLLLGIGTLIPSSQHMEGGTMVRLANWAQHVVTFRGQPIEQLISVSWVYKTHIFLGLTLFLLAPFTRLVHIWSIPISYLWRPYQVVRRRQATLRYGGPQE